MTSSWTTSGSWSKLGSENNFTGSGLWDRAKDLESPFKPGGLESGYTPSGRFNFDADLGKKAFGADDSKFNWGQAAGLASSFLQEAKDKGKQDEAMQKLPYALGKGTGGFGGQILDNLGVVMPQQHGPIVIPGVGGQSSGMGSKIGRFAGAALGAVIGGPAGMAIGGTLGGGAGSFFD